MPLNSPQHCLNPLGVPMPTYATYTPSGAWVPALPASPLIHPWHPPMLLMPPKLLLVVNFHHFATDRLHAVRMLIFYCCHFQLSWLCYWPSSWVCPVYKIPSLGVKNTSSVLWGSANFCNMSKNMHYKDPVASQCWKTNKVVWTWKDDWPPWRTSTIYQRG